MKKMVVLSALTLIVVTAGFAQKPAHNVSPKKHPNLSAAQALTAKAYQRVLDAQKANEWDLAGHAQKAKDLLDQANAELKQAAQQSNKNKAGGKM